MSGIGWPTSSREQLVPILRVVYAAERWAWIIRAFAGREVLAALPVRVVPRILNSEYTHPARAFTPEQEAFEGIARRCSIPLDDAEEAGGLPVPPSVLWAAPRAFPLFDSRRYGNRQLDRWEGPNASTRDQVRTLRRSRDPLEALRLWELLIVWRVWEDAAARLGSDLPARAKLDTEQGRLLLDRWTAAHESRLAQIRAAIEQRSALLQQLGWSGPQPKDPLSP